MILQPTPPEREFISTVREFVAQNWRADATRPAGLLHELGAEAMTVAERNWFDALVGAGWSVPAWPLSAGGPGWSRTRQFLFARELAAAGAPLPLSVATEVVAPLLLAAGAGPTYAAWLEGIRSWRSRWCLGIAEPAGSSPSGTVATGQADGYLLSGEKTWVAGGRFADWMLCQARMPDRKLLLTAGTEGHAAAASPIGWFVVPLRAPEVSIEPLPLMGGDLAMARVVIQALKLDPVHFLGPCLGETQRPVSAASLVRSAALKRDFQRWQATTPIEDDELRRLSAQLGVLLDGLESMEFRGLADPDFLPPAALRGVLAIRGAEAGQQLSELRRRSMGYHAVPFPDAVRFDNEGVFGDELALPVIRQTLFDRAWTLYAAHQTDQPLGGGTSVEAMRDELARLILGLDPTQVSRESGLGPG